MKNIKSLRIWNSNVNIGLLKECLSCVDGLKKLRAGILNRRAEYVDFNGCAARGAGSA